MYLFILIVLILLGALFLISLLFFVRYLILKKNIGCGLLGLFAMVVISFVIYFHSKILSHHSESDFIYDFEYVLDLSYPHSGKIIERKYEGGLSFMGDYEEAAIIEIDTIDYTRLLQDIQLNKNFELDTSLTMLPYLLEKKIPINEFDYIYQKKYISKHNCCLWFHKSKKIIVFENIKN